VTVNSSPYASFARRARAAFALVAVLAVTAALAPRLTLFLNATIHDPRRLPALPTDPRIRHEPAAADCARVVEETLPDAMHVVEKTHGRPFAQAPTIAVYDSFDIYARANGLGDPEIAATTLSDRIALSPTLCGAERARLAPVLTHELSHAHLFGWRGLLASRPPSWFVEGLAVETSGGAGAEGVSEDEAKARMAEGRLLETPDRGIWTDASSIRFSDESDEPYTKKDLVYRRRLAFRQAAMIVAWLRARDGDAFVELLRRLEAREDFATAFEAAYRTNVSKLSSLYRATIENDGDVASH
jgi:hypothetical protein